MSLGFLTESALLPSKAKAIKVDSKSILDLKAVVFQKEQERNERRRRLHEEATRDDRNDHDPSATNGGSSRRRQRSGDEDDGDIGDAMGKNVYARLKAQKRSRVAARQKQESNRGVDERRRRDNEQRELDIDNSDDDEALQRKSRAMLERKAKLYEQMMQGQRDAVPAAAAKECLVDFDGKWRAQKTDGNAVADRPLSEHVSETVEIIDEFGRTRMVERGSSEHVECTQRGSGTQPAESLFFEDKRVQERAPRSDHAGGSFVVSQWEKTLKSTEKQYLEEVHAGTELAKQTASASVTDKQRRKQLRLEKLKQQQQHQGQPSVSASSASTDTVVDRQQDKDAAVQATAFLNQFTSSFM